VFIVCRGLCGVGYTVAMSEFDVDIVFVRG